MADPGYRIRPADPEDIPAILQLVRGSLGQGTVPRTAEFWSWKHARNPFGASACLVAEAGRGIVGLRAFLRWQWMFAGESIRAVRPVDTATHPEWRGKGIFSKLTLKLVEEMRAEGVFLVYNTPNKISRAGYVKMGWQEVGRLPVLIRPLRPLKTAARLCLGFISGGLPPQELENLPDVKAIFESDGLETFLSKLWREEKRLHTARTIEYLRWRYEDVPGLGYRALWKFDGESGAAVIARFRMRGALKEISLSEVLCTADENGRKIVSSIIDRISCNTRADYLIASAAGGTAEYQGLRKSGFMPITFPGPWVTVRPLNPQLPLDPAVWSSWRLSIGDLEVF